MTAIQETKVELLREKNIKPTAYSNKATGYELSDFFNLNKQTPTNDLKHLKRAYVDDLNDTPINSPSVDSQATETPSTDNTNRIETLRYELRESERKRKLESESSDTWRTKYRFADTELQKRDIEVTNLKFEIERMNKLLEAAYAKDALMDGVMKLYLDTKAKLIDSVEGEVSDIWR